MSSNSAEVTRLLNVAATCGLAALLGCAGRHKTVVDAAPEAAADSADMAPSAAETTITDASLPDAAMQDRVAEQAADMADGRAVDSGGEHTLEDCSPDLAHDITDRNGQSDDGADDTPVPDGWGEPAGDGQPWGGELSDVDGDQIGEAFVSQTGLQHPIGAGAGFSCAVGNGGAVWCWGWNSNGKLGNGGTEDASSPTLVPGISGVTTLAAGFGHVCALEQDGTVWCWGRNDGGQLGDGTYEDSPLPKQVLGLDDAIAVAVGDPPGQGHSCAVKADGRVWCWGNNLFGKCGSKYGKVPVPTKVEGLPSDAASVAAGATHTCGLLTDGTVWCWGDNGSGQLGVPQEEVFYASSVPVQAQPLQGISAIAARWYTTCAVSGAGEVRCWGDEYVIIGEDWWIAPGWYPGKVFGIEGAMGVAVGEKHGCAVVQDGTAYCWGMNGQGQLGNGTTENSMSAQPAETLTKVIAVAAGFDHSCAQLEDGAVWCWGDNYAGELGNGTTEDSPIPVQVKYK